MENKIIKLQNILLDIFANKKILLRHSSKLFVLYELVSMVMIFLFCVYGAFYNYFYEYLINLFWHTIMVWLVALPVIINFAKNNIKIMYVTCFIKAIVALMSVLMYFGRVRHFQGDIFECLLYMIPCIIGTINSIFVGIIFAVTYFKRNYRRINNQF